MELIQAHGALRHIHLASVAFSGGFFVLRGLWMLGESTILRRRWVRILPHVVDTVLLLSGVLLVFATRQWPDEQPWLAAKLIALVVYIGLGMVALRRRQAMALFAAVAVFVYMVAVALTRQAWPLS